MRDLKFALGSLHCVLISYLWYNQNLIALGRIHTAAVLLPADVSSWVSPPPISCALEVVGPILSMWSTWLGQGRDAMWWCKSINSCILASDSDQTQHGADRLLCLDHCCETVSTGYHLLLGQPQKCSWPSVLLLRPLSSTGSVPCSWLCPY